MLGNCYDLFGAFLEFGVKIPVSRVDNVEGGGEGSFFFGLEGGFPFEDAVVLVFDGDFVGRRCFASDFDFRVLGDWKLVDEDDLVSYGVVVGHFVGVFALQGSGLVYETGVGVFLRTFAAFHYDVGIGAEGEFGFFFRENFFKSDFG